MKHKRLKNYLKLGILLFGISLVLINCQKDELTFDANKQINAKTVSFEEAKAFFEHKKGNNLFAKQTTSNELVLIPDWNSLEHSDLVYTDAQLTKANTDVNRTGDFSSKLLFVNINDEIQSIILTTWVTDYDSYGNIVNATIYFNDYESNFIDAYKIENGLFTKRLVPKNIQTASFYMFQEIFTPDCWNTDDLEGGELDTVDLGTVSSGSSSFDGGNIDGPANGPGTGSVDYGGYVNGAVSGGGSSNGAITAGGIDIGSATILMNPIDDESEIEAKPCKGNPIIGKLEIAPQKGKSKSKGALHGCTRYGGSCTGDNGRNKFHAGIDIKSEHGNPIYAMYDGFIYSTKYDSNGAGFRRGV
mgnify:CR=1 FL=1